MPIESYNNFDEVRIPNGAKKACVDIFFASEGKKKILLEANTSLSYLIIIYGQTTLDIVVETLAANASIDIKVLLIGKVWHTTTIDIQANLLHSNTEANLHLVSLLQDASSVVVNGKVCIGENIVKASGHLLEENIILWKSVTIKTLPFLDVRSNDVSASHGARIEKLDAKKLFYARSRGLNESQAKGLIIWGYFDVLFDTIIKNVSDMTDKAHIEALKNNYFKMLLW